MENNKKSPGIFERIAINILAGKGYKIKDKMVLSETRVPAGKELGAAQASAALLAQQLKASEIKEQPEEKSDAEEWEERKKTMARFSSWEGRAVLGHKRVYLGKLMEFYVDVNGNPWFNTLIGKGFNVFGGRSWRDTFDTNEEKPQDGSIHINYHKDDSGNIKYFDTAQYQAIVDPQDVFLDPSHTKVNVPKLLDSFDRLQADNESLADRVVDLTAESARIEKNMELRVMELANIMERLNKRFELLTKPLPQKEKKEEAPKDGPKNTQ